jgi:hypothetical protein
MFREVKLHECRRCSACHWGPGEHISLETAFVIINMHLDIS